MKAFYCVLGLAVSSAAFAGTGGSVGSQAATWLGLPDSARIASMGGASVALADDVNTLSVNPAGLGSLDGQQVSLMHDDYVQESSLEHLAYGVGLGAYDGLAVGLNYMNYGSVATNTVSNGQLVSTGSINPYGEGLDLAYGHAFGGGFLAGATVEGVTENLTGGATNAAVGGDVGALWRQNPDDGLSIGAAVQNFGSQLDGADLPTNYQAGLAYRLLLDEGRQALNFAGDAAFPAADPDSESLSLGAEYRNSIWAVRAGYKFVGDEGSGGLSGGVGLRYQIFSLDYAYVSYGLLGAANQVSASAKF